MTVGVLQAFGNINSVLDRAVEGQIAFPFIERRDDGAQSAAGKILQYQKNLAIVFGDVVYRLDVRVIQGGEGLPFFFESSDAIGGRRQLFAQKLQNDRTMQPPVAREIHHTHAAFAEFVGDVVMRYDLSEHVAPSGQVACPVCRYYTPATGTRRACVDSTNR